MWHSRLGCRSCGTDILWRYIADESVSLFYTAQIVVVSMKLHALHAQHTLANHRVFRKPKISVVSSLVRQAVDFE